MITNRIDAITKISEKWLGEVLPAPRSVKIEITANCNYRCTFCVKSLRADEGHMDRVLYSRLIREMREAGVEVRLGRAVRRRRVDSSNTSCGPRTSRPFPRRTW